MFELHCKDAGFDCAGVVRGSTKKEVLMQAAAHAQKEHNVQVTPEMAATIEALIREAGTKG